MTRRLLVLIILLTFSQLLSAAVWETRHQWDDWWEQRFSEWVETSFHKDIFIYGRFADLPHDCADAVYFARLIFAYDNELPFVIRNPRGTNLSKKYPESMHQHLQLADFIDNQMPHFDHLPEKQRLRQFMLFIADIVWTKTLIEDTYPVALTPEAFKPGVVAVLPRGPVFSGGLDLLAGGIHETGMTTAGHAQIVTSIDDMGVIYYLKSSLPARIASMQETTLNTFHPHKRGGSFRYWKRPVHYAMNDKDIPGYGTEQFDVDGIFEDLIQLRLAMSDESRQEKLKRYANEICTQIEQRIPVIQTAWEFKKTIATRCMNYEEYDQYSTPMRDKKIRIALRYLLFMSPDKQQAGALIEQQLDDNCLPLQISDELTTSPGKFARSLLDPEHKMSDPNQSLAVRWGLESPYETACKAYY